MPIYLAENCTQYLADRKILSFRLYILRSKVCCSQYDHNVRETHISIKLDGDINLLKMRLPIVPNKIRHFHPKSAKSQLNPPGWAFESLTSKYNYDFIALCNQAKKNPMAALICVLLGILLLLVVNSRLGWFSFHVLERIRQSYCRAPRVTVTSQLYH